MLFQLCFSVSPPTVARPASLSLPLRVPGQGLACGAGCWPWLPEGVSDPAPLPQQYLLSHWFLSCSLPQIFISDLLPSKQKLITEEKEVDRDFAGFVKMWLLQAGGVAAVRFVFLIFVLPFFFQAYSQAALLYLPDHPVGPVVRYSHRERQAWFDPRWAFSGYGSSYPSDSKTGAAVATPARRSAL